VQQLSHFLLGTAIISRVSESHRNQTIINRDAAVCASVEKSPATCDPWFGDAVVVGLIW
jgi:hypothetical protein